MTPERLAVLVRVADGLPDLDRPVLVVVDGADGAGKTTIADDLAALLEESGRPVVRDDRGGGFNNDRDNHRRPGAR